MMISQTPLTSTYPRLVVRHAVQQIYNKLYNKSKTQKMM